MGRHQNIVGESDSRRRNRENALRRQLITTGPLRSTLFFLAIPVLGEQLLNAFIGLFDTYLAGNLRSGNTVAATSAVGLAAYVGWLSSMIVMLVGTGTTALITRYAGRGEHDEANRYANQSMTMAVGMGAGLFALFFLLAPGLARYCRMTDEAFDITVSYLRIDAVGHIFMSVTLVGSAALRGVGNMRTPMLIFALINAINVVASCTLVFGLGPFPEMGITGIVAGTLTARIFGAVLMLFVLFRGRGGVVLRLHELTTSWNRVRRILRIGVPAAADGAILWSGHFALLAIVTRVAEGAAGQAALAANIIAVRVEALTYLPAVAWGTATATMIGQSLGAGIPDRAKRAGYAAALQCGALSVVMAAFFYFGAGFIYEQMSADPLVRGVGVPPFRMLALLQPLMAVSIVFIWGMRGAGDTRYPMMITIVGVFIRVSAGY
ncbi:MAG: MATE family efflux transporter, partial [Planctomycetes bacterium]|nr:MATE family efflux transporter [Planctomycetota bacterium]